MHLRQLHGHENDIILAPMEIAAIVLVIITLFVIAGRRKPMESARSISDQDEQKKQEQTDELITVILPTIDNDK